MFDAARLFEAAVAAELVLMTTDMMIFLDAERGVRATVVIGWAAPIRAGLGNPLLRRTSYRRAPRKLLAESCGNIFGARADFSKVA
jgi:hypothetical protein